MADKRTTFAKGLVKGKARVTDDAREVTRAKDIDIVVELIGGYGIACRSRCSFSISAMRT